jgi:hypothetical protein
VGIKKLIVKAEMITTMILITETSSRNALEINIGTKFIFRSDEKKCQGKNTVEFPESWLASAGFRPNPFEEPKE